MRHAHRFPIALLLAAACAGSEHRDDSTLATPAPGSAAGVDTLATSGGPSIPTASMAASNPAAALARFLAYESFRGAPAGSDSLSYCPPLVTSDGESEEGWEPDNYVGFVRPRVLETSMVKKDTPGNLATGRAELVRVASIDRDSGWVGTLLQKLDTLTFALQRGPTGWTVCGPAAKPGADSLPSEMTFVITYADVLRTEVNEARWMPTGTTPEDVARHADSVLAAGRLN